VADLMEHHLDHDEADLQTDIEYLERAAGLQRGA
jgi:hypothetical protein